MLQPRPSRTGLRVACLLSAALLLSACAGDQDAAPGDGINDPYEAGNRKVHNFNRDLDRALVRPVSRGYVKAVPGEAQMIVGNFATNLGKPAVATNSLLQGDLRGFGLSTYRFVLNSTLGIAGLFDVATELGIADHDTDFGETLHVWGAGEGAYIELPLLGPSTQRDALGKVVDLFTNPVTYRLNTTESNTARATSIASRVGDRGRFSDTVDFRIV